MKAKQSKWSECKVNFRHGAITHKVNRKTGCKFSDGSTNWEERRACVCWKCFSLNRPQKWWQREMERDGEMMASHRVSGEFRHQWGWTDHKNTPARTLHKACSIRCYWPRWRLQVESVDLTTFFLLYACCSSLCWFFCVGKKYIFKPH